MSETQEDPSRDPRHIALIMTASDIWKSLIAIIPIGLVALYVMAGVMMHSWTPGFGVFRPTPDGYQSVRAFQAARTHDFPALLDQPPPAPVAESGHLITIKDAVLYGVTNRPDPAPEVKSLRLTRVFGPSITAHLDMPLNAELRTHLLRLRKGAIVTVAGIGHGDGGRNVYIYPVHHVDDIEP